jgi:conjugative transfer pilus assembly protein TraH
MVRSTRVIKEVVIGLLAASMIVVPAAQGANLDNVFDQMGAYANLTGPSAYYGQAANYYSGGSFFLRVPDHNYQLVTVTPGHLRAGCSGIDFYAGSFSVINKDQMIAMLKNIGSAAIGYAFTLALGTICPECKNGIQWMNDIAKEANKMQINSCEAAQKLVDGLGGEWLKSRTALATNRGRENNTYPDQYASSSAVRADADATQSQINDAKNDPRLAEVIDDGNLTWRALKKIDDPVIDDQMRQFMMSVIGTVVFDGSGDNLSITAYGPTGITLDNIIGEPGMWPVSTGPVYHCQNATGAEDLSEMGCRNPVPVADVTIADQSIRSRVATELRNILTAIQNNTPIQYESMQFLGVTPFPVYRLLSVASVTPIPLAVIRDATELVSMEYASSYFEYVFHIIDKSLSRAEIARSQIAQNKVEQLRHRIDELRHKIYEQKAVVYAQANTKLDLVQEVIQMEKQSMGALPGVIAKSIAYSSGMKAN